jgi:hypothetical protein
VTPLVLPGLGVAFAAPWGLALGVGAAGALVALHAVTVGRPRPAALPTARFAPDRPPRAARRVRRPSDLVPLALRVTAALAAGAALAGPVPVPARAPVRRLVLADRSRAADSAQVRAAVRAVARPGDVVVPFAAAPGAPATVGDTAGDAAGDTAAGNTAAAGAARDRALDAVLGAAPESPRAAGSLSAALVAARRLAPGLAAGADSLELVLVSPLVAEEADAATARVRAAWPGRARVVRVAARRADDAGRAAPARPAVALRGGPPDDAVAAALALAGVRVGDDAPVRVVRGRVTDADRAWVRGGGADGPGGAAAAGRLLLDWPVDGTPAGARPVAPDTAHGLVATAGGAGATAVTVAPFARRAALDEPGAAAGAAAAEQAAGQTAESGSGRARVIARWADGRPAADERDEGAGCVRRVAVAVPQAGDAALRAGFRALLGALLGPCGGPRDFAPLPRLPSRRSPARARCSPPRRSAPSWPRRAPTGSAPRCSASPSRRWSASSRCVPCSAAARSRPTAKPTACAPRPGRRRARAARAVRSRAA